MMETLLLGRRSTSARNQIHSTQKLDTCVHTHTHTQLTQEQSKNVHNRSSICILPGLKLITNNMCQLQYTCELSTGTDKLSHILGTVH